MNNTPCDRLPQAFAGPPLPSRRGGPHHRPGGRRRLGSHPVASLLRKPPPVEYSLAGGSRDPEESERKKGRTHPLLVPLVGYQSSVLRSGRSVPGPIRPGFLPPVAPVSNTSFSPTPQRMTAFLASLVGQKSAAPVIPTGDRLDSSGPRRIASRQVNRSPFLWSLLLKPYSYQYVQ